MQALGWFLALFTFWMALLLTGSEALSSKDGDGAETEWRALGLEKGKSYVFRTAESPSGKETESTAADLPGPGTEYRVQVDDVVLGPEATLTVSLRREDTAPAPEKSSTYRIIVGSDGRVKDVRTLDVADAAGVEAARIRQLRAGFESLFAGEPAARAAHPGERESAHARRS